MLRAFIAIPVEKQEIVSNLQAAQKKLKKSGASIKYVERENFHILLKFLGQVSKKEISAIHSCLEEAINPYNSFNIEIKGIGCFPSLNYIRVIWAGVSEGKRQVGSLAGSIEDSLAKISIPKEEREYLPHLTLGRMRSGKNKNEVKKIVKRKRNEKFGQMRVKEIKLFRSKLTRKGPIYSTLKRYEL